MINLEGQEMIKKNNTVDRAYDGAYIRALSILIVYPKSPINIIHFNVTRSYNFMIRIPSGTH